MVGFYAIGDSSQPMRTDLDNELEGEAANSCCPADVLIHSLCILDAKWYTREEILRVLSHVDGTNLTGRDHSKMAAAQEERDHAGKGTAGSTANALAGDAVTDEEKQKNAKLREEPSELPFRVPPLTAIAGVLISEWAYRRAGPGSDISQAKGSL